ncbi:phospholipid carrier-dependent glycosyltransferase [Alteriqipengyuania lutimaris]|uniref:Polyprenol-phosphate-mannose--protein mannosyltransferase n=1 Tax=Alteriqipengyuania lutimaris TaxID=1538146 RepID=A0A395LH51_9SPHN|nr:phospholipid carrier-dependent glycosyltransferase [Alteriqipengyuania lutimaris]MBB3035342.1 dolichyl-phosphate-mannose--protein O-mannosyl transferase [Alteriqipengyuania lutimaris]RDS75929.1 phospholipid carrier-dependent glycosyltransferase [Alteriqipengyuania lutimaris]
MSHARADRIPQRDPLLASIGLAMAFFGLCLWRLWLPSGPYFDEIHYLPAARDLLTGYEYRNPEHPPLGKEIIAAGIGLLGDNAWGWRFFSALAGSLALFAAMRGLWHASRSRDAVLAYGVLLATGFLLFVHAQIAMLDIFMVAFFLAALWQLAAAFRNVATGRARVHLAAAGVALGCAIASKWNAAPLAPMLGLFFLAARLWAVGPARALTARDAAPVRGVGLVEAALWLGLLPMLVYAATFWPAFQVEGGPFDGMGLIGAHRHMLELQQSVKQGHPYQSTWAQWVLNTRAIWYLYEVTDGAQRGVMLIGNPLTMMLGLAGVAWCGWAAVAARRADAAAVFVLYAASIGFWMIAAKPIQFYYHYFLPSCFLLAGLALAIAWLKARGIAWAYWLALAGSVAVFAYFYPILSAAELEGEQAFNFWMWRDGWR